MISYFRINDPLRIAGLFILLILIRIPIMVIGIPFTIPELHWLLIGERLGNGFLVYRDVWDNIAPLSALFYWLIGLLFGKSLIAYKVISAILVFFQSIIFNRIMRFNDVYLERTYVPGLIYIVLSSIFFDFFTLSPVLLGITFLIIPLGILFRLINKDRSDEKILKLGFYIGIATLFHFPLFVFIFLSCFCLLLFTTVKLRGYILLFFGFLLPVCIASVFFFWFDATEEFFRMFIGSFFSLEKTYFLSYKAMLVVIGAPAFLLLFALFKVFNSRKFQNYQIKCRGLMFFWLVLSIAVCFFSILKAPFQIIVFIPATAFFGAHYFLLIKKKWVSELIFFAFFLTIITVNYRSMKGYIERVNIEKLLVKQTDFTSPPESEKRGIGETENGKTKQFTDSPIHPFTDSVRNSGVGDLGRAVRIVVLGNNINHYKGNSLATPYLNWQLAKKHFNDLDNYAHVFAIYKNFKNDLPDYIIDEEGITEKLFHRIPLLGEKYYRISKFGNLEIWKLKKNITS